MNRIGLKVNGIWCVLPQDVSISIEEQNPLFSDSGSFSYPIELSISQNRELFKSIDSPQGRIRPQDLDGLPFELWFDGVMLLYGSTETDEDLDIDEDKCSINLVSGNGDFQSKIEGMQCTDVPLLGKVKLGYSFPEVEVDCKKSEDSDEYFTEVCDIDEANLMNFENSNVSFSYKDGFPFCNVRICFPKKEDYKVGEEEPYWVLDASRPFSGVCFYVAYFMECLFNSLGYVVKGNCMKDVEDLSRLAFFTTKCDVEYGDREVYLESSSYKEINEGTIHCALSFTTNYLNAKYRVIKKDVYATNKNYPNVPVTDVVESLMNAFGLKVICNELTKDVSLVLFRDILRDNEILDMSIPVLNKSISYSKVKGVTLTYGGDDDDTVFNYNDWSKVEVFTNYREVMMKVNPYNKTCYVGKNTGNKYRFKNDKDAEEEGDEAKLFPTLFEVAQYNDYVLGEKTDNNIELAIKFSPLIENAVSGDADQKILDINPQRLAVYVPVELSKPKTDNVSSIISNDGRWNQIFSHGYAVESDDAEAGGGYMVSSDLYFVSNRYINYDLSEHSKSPLQDYDSGFTLGVMRGPGSVAKTEVYLENYDGNGNSAWTTVVADYAFTADTMDAYGNRYDYNGTAEGGVANQENSISLKTHIQTAKDVGLENEDWGIDATAAKRGLADRFMSEYMHFLLHRKTVNMEVDTTLSQLTSLSWFKQLRINNTVGRLKSRSYTLTNSGVSDMNIELYTIN